MHNLEEAAKWLADVPDAYARAYEAVNHCLEVIGFKAFKQRAERDGISDAELFAEISEFFTVDCVRKILRRERENFEASPVYVSNFAPLEGKFYSGFAVYQSQAVVTMLLAIDPWRLAERKRRAPDEKRTITFSGTWAHLKVISGEAVEIARWRADDVDDRRDLKNDPPRAERVELHRLRAGEEMSFGPGEEYEFVSVDGAMLLLLSHRLSGPAPLSTEFDAASGALVATAAVSQEPTRLQMLGTILRLFGRNDAADDIRILLEDDRHFVRWHGMRELLALEGEAMLPELLRMADEDPQPSVRRAALHTLQTFFPDQLSIAAE
jgi:hypothetical protein